MNDIVNPRTDWLPATFQSGPTSQYTGTKSPCDALTMNWSHPAPDATQPLVAPVANPPLVTGCVLDLSHRS